MLAKPLYDLEVAECFLPAVPIIDATLAPTVGKFLLQPVEGHDDQVILKDALGPACECDGCFVLVRVHAMNNPAIARMPASPATMNADQNSHGKM